MKRLLIIVIMIMVFASCDLVFVDMKDMPPLNAAADSVMNPYVFPVPEIDPIDTEILYGVPFIGLTPP